MAADEPVNFTRGAAERIAGAVRKVEAGSRNGGALTSDRVYDDVTIPRKVFRVGSFTPPWDIGTDKTVTLKNMPSTPNTVLATNLFLPIPASESVGSRDCAIGRSGTSWYLIQVQWDARDFVSDATIGTAAIEFTRYAGVSLATASSVQLSITTCDATGS